MRRGNLKLNEMYLGCSSRKKCLSEIGDLAPHIVFRQQRYVYYHRPHRSQFNPQAIPTWRGVYWSPYLGTGRPKCINLWTLRHIYVVFVLYNVSKYVTFPTASKRCSKSKAWSVISQAKIWLNSIAASISQIQPAINLFVNIIFICYCCSQIF
jgi:hypothetical protein